jgi:hypothetical protein
MKPMTKEHSGRRQGIEHRQRERQEPSDVPGFGRVGGIDDPVARAEYGDDPETVRSIRAEARDECRAESDAGLYYLPFGSDQTRDLRHRIQHDGDIPTLAEFGTLYEHVGDDRADDLNNVWEQWNRGSGDGSRAFIDAETRSLSVGDIVIFDGDGYLCQHVGWQLISLVESVNRQEEP